MRIVALGVDHRSQECTDRLDPSLRLSGQRVERTLGIGGWPQMCTAAGTFVDGVA